MADKIWLYHAFSLFLYSITNQSNEMKRLLTWLLVVGALLPAAAQQITEQDKERAAALVERMTLDEKLDYIGGFNSFYIRAIPRLGIPQIRMADGPQGVRNDTRSTMFPCGIAAAAAWDRALVRDYGRALGQDCRARGVHILLGPGVSKCCWVRG